MRLHQLISQHKSTRRQKVDDISFIIPDQPIEIFGRTFESMDEVTDYCAKNNIPYSKEKGPFDFDAYIFQRLKTDYATGPGNS